MKTHRYNAHLTGYAAPSGLGTSGFATAVAPRHDTYYTHTQLCHLSVFAFDALQKGDWSQIPDREHGNFLPHSEC